MSEPKKTDLPAGSRESTEMYALVSSVSQLVAKVGLQINGQVAVAQAIADAFNTMNPVLEEFKKKATNLARENDALVAEVNRLRDKVNKKQ